MNKFKYSIKSALEMGLDRLLRCMMPFNPETKYKCIERDFITGVLIKISGGLVTAASAYLHFNPPENSEPNNFILPMAVGAGMYLVGVVTDYVAIRRTDAWYNSKREEWGIQHTKNEHPYEED